jgi:hypothetical protein
MPFTSERTNGEWARPDPLAPEHRGEMWRKIAITLIDAVLCSRLLRRLRGLLNPFPRFLHVPCLRIRLSDA